MADDWFSGFGNWVQSVASNIAQGVSNPGDALNSANIKMQAAARGLSVDQYMPLLAEYQRTPHPAGTSFDDFLANNPIGKAIAPILATGGNIGSDGSVGVGVSGGVPINTSGQNPSNAPQNAMASNVGLQVDNAVGQQNAIQHSAMPMNTPQYTPGSIPNNVPNTVNTGNVGLTTTHIVDVQPQPTPSLGMSPLYPNGSNPSNMSPASLMAANTNPNGFVQTGGGPTQSITSSTPEASATPTKNNNYNINDMLAGASALAPLAGAAVNGALGLYAGDQASKTAINAGNVAANGYDQAGALSQQQYVQQQTYLNPYIQAALGPNEDGKSGALADLQNFDTTHTMGDFQASPNYQFRLSEGMKALQNASGANGQGIGGNTMKALNNYAQDSATAGYDDWFNQRRGLLNDQRSGLQDIAHMGQSATNQAVNASQNYTTNMGNDQIGAATAKANAMIGAANVNSSAYTNLGTNFTNAATTLFNNAGQIKLINALNTKTGAS